MHASAAPHPVVLAGCRVGANPIIWSNDDFPELNGDLPLDTILREMRECGYAGSELGHAYPRRSLDLAAALARHGLALVSGWHSTYFVTRTEAEEEHSFRQHLALLQVLGARVVIVAECSRCLHGDRRAPLRFAATESSLRDEEWTRLAAGLARCVALARASGLKVVYHHHMGTVIQQEADLDQLLERVPDLQLVLDPGHLVFAGIDPLGVLRRHGPRVAHVHLKSVRAEVAARARTEGWSFCRAVTEGVFTIPGDGVVDFPAIFRALAALRYEGWLVAEAEEDPAKAPPAPKARRARDYIRAQAGV